MNPLLESRAVEPSRIDYISVSCIYGFYTTRICISNYINNVHFIEYLSIPRHARLHSQHPSYGVLTSSTNLAKLMQTFLDPTRRECLISPSTLREWLRPMHAWIDDLTEVGLMWEILKIPGSFGRRQRVYQKYMSCHALVPASWLTCRM